MQTSRLLPVCSVYFKYVIIINIIGMHIMPGILAKIRSMLSNKTFGMYVVLQYDLIKL